MIFNNDSAQSFLGFTSESVFMTHIRPANPADSPVLAQLRYKLRSRAIEDLEPESEFLKRCSTWMADRLRQPLWRCWVAEEDSEIVGALWLQLIEKIPNPTTEVEFHAYITNVFVNESARGKGVGSQLLTQAIEFCKHETVHAVILWPSEKSRTLYQRHGFDVRWDLMELVLGESTLKQ
jgi:GNAT superfamily N-acetyltransferase